MPQPVIDSRKLLALLEAAQVETDRLAGLFARGHGEDARRHAEELRGIAFNLNLAEAIVGGEAIREPLTLAAWERRRAEPLSV